MGASQSWAWKWSKKGLEKPRSSVGVVLWASRQLHSQTQQLGIAGELEIPRVGSSTCSGQDLHPSWQGRENLPQKNKTKKKEPIKIISTLSPNNETFKIPRWGGYSVQIGRGRGRGMRTTFPISAVYSLVWGGKRKKRIFAHFNGNFSSRSSGRSRRLQSPAQVGRGICWGGQAESDHCMPFWGWNWLNNSKKWAFLWWCACWNTWARRSGGGKGAEGGRRLKQRAAYPHHDFPPALPALSFLNIAHCHKISQLSLRIQKAPHRWIDSTNQM